MVNELPVRPVATSPSGKSEGIRTLAYAAQPFRFAGSFQVEKLTP